MGPGAKQAIVILFAMVPDAPGDPAIAAGRGRAARCAGAVIPAVTNVEPVRRAISWTTVILVGAMMPLSTAMVETGAAKMLAERLVYMVGDAGPMALLAGLFVLERGHAASISNTATALSSSRSASPRRPAWASRRAPC